MSDVKGKVEDWVKGLTSSVRADPTAGGGLEDLTLTPKPKERRRTPKPFQDTAAVVGITESLATCGARPRSTRHWKRVACEALGIRSIGAKRWGAIVSEGERHGLFRQERVGKGSNAFNTLHHIEAEDLPEETPQVPTVPEPEEVEDTPTRPEDWNPPKTLECGHINWGTVAAHEAAIADGKCCANWKDGSINWRVKGLNTQVPANSRRSKDREQRQGFPGLCCDPETGLYIGGLGNDCRVYHDGSERCIVHGEGGSVPRGDGRGGP